MIFFWERSTSEKKKPPAGSHFGSDPLTGVAEGGVRVDARHHRAVLFAHLSICIVYFFKVSAQMLFLHICILYFYKVSAQMLLFLFLYLCHLLCAAIPLPDIPLERCQHALLGDASSITISHKHGFGVMLYKAIPRTTTNTEILQDCTYSGK